MIKTDNRTSQHRLPDKPVPLTHATEQPDKLSLLTSALVSAHELASWVIPVAAAAELMTSLCSVTPHLGYYKLYNTTIRQTIRNVNES